MDVKQKMFVRMENIADRAAVLASNTSCLSITAIASRCRRPERVLTMHFWNPPHVMPLVEIVQGEKTSAAVAQSVRELVAACGKVPVMVKKEPARPARQPSANGAGRREAAYIVEEGIADVEDVDLVAKNGFGLRMPAYGIFEHQDAVGLDMALGMSRLRGQRLMQPAQSAQQLPGESGGIGDLGAKTGKGFYDFVRKSRLKK